MKEKIERANWRLNLLLKFCHQKVFLQSSADVYLQFSQLSAPVWEYNQNLKVAQMKASEVMSLDKYIKLIDLYRLYIYYIISNKQNRIC